MMRRTSIIVLAVALGSSAQTGLSQAPGSVTPPPKASASVSGIVADAQTQSPVRHAVVRINSADSFSGGRVTLADAQGRFEITGLTGGTYVLSATRVDYLTTTLGQQRPDGPGAAFDLADGETKTGFVIPIQRGGVITGRVVDDYGDPAAGVQVFALQRQVESGDTPVRPVGFPVTTDDRGLFRLFMLQPGQYYVLARLNDAGSPVSEAAPAPVGTYFPASAELANAVGVNVVNGRETTADIMLRSARFTEIRGRALGANGLPLAGAAVSLSTRVSGIIPSVSSVTAGADGAFAFTSVAPGQYLVAAQRGGVNREADIEKGFADVTVGDEPVGEVLIRASRGAVMRGVIVTESGEPVPLPSAAFAVRAVISAGELDRSQRSAGVDENYRFELTGLFGRHRLEVVTQGTASQWAVKRIRYGGTDVTNEVFSFQGQVIDGVEIVLSDRWATLSGIVRDANGRPAGDAPLVLFPVDPSLRIPESRSIRGMRSDREGRFGVSWLLPGEYLLATPATMKPNEWNDPSFLERLEATALRITLSEDDEQTVEIRIGKSP
jgi:hypothetical protein